MYPKVEACYCRIARIANIEHWKGIPVKGVLAQDTDFYIYNCNYIPLSSLKIDMTGVETSAKAVMCEKDSFAKELMDLGASHLVKVLTQGGVNPSLRSTLMLLFKNKCPLNRFVCMLPDLAMLSGNDYYTSDHVDGNVCLGNKHISPHLLSLVGGYIDRKVLPKCKIALYTTDTRRSSDVKYTNFEAACAFLIVCGICNYDHNFPRGGLNVNNPSLQAILFTKNTSHASEAGKYASARDMYSMESPQAMNLTPHALEIAKYGSLYKQRSICR